MKFVGPGVDVLGFSRIFLAVFALSAGIFLIFPQIDLWFSALFYNPVDQFFLKDRFFCIFIYRSVEILAVFLAAGLPLLFLTAVIFKKSVLHMIRRHLIYLILVLALGPGLLVNVVLKDYWGRARPDQIERFGGTRRFTPAFVISRECDRNCSFVSGHASFGFSLVSMAFLLRRHRKKSVALAISFGFLIGFVRILQGSHFASDVVFSFFAVYMVAKGLFMLMLKTHEVTKGQVAPGDVLKPVTDEKR